jgi:hypothetical protein
MSVTEKGTWVGQLSLALLFEGSKSEGHYPVLDTADGRRFRVHVKGNRTFDAQALGDLMNQRVRLPGVVDDLRGHWRLVLEPTLLGEVLSIEHSATMPDTIPKEDMP